MLLKPLQIGELTARIPIIQGGMGVGVSRSRLAGAVAKAGGIGILSTAQIGYDEPDFLKHPIESNLQAVEKHIKAAKEIGEGGVIGVNIMVATKQYDRYVRAAAEAGADVIICGAGLPITLPELVKGCASKIAPIVSSLKAASVILKMWDRKYHTTADFLVVEGPKAGGHLGFSKEQLENLDSMDYDEEIRKIIEYKKGFEEKYHHPIPVIVAGGIFDHKDVECKMELGADGVQVASRFVVTEECDAHDNYKQAYIHARPSDIKIVISPVGMPGRAIWNPFLEKVKEGKQSIDKCWQCLEKCNPKETPYCISRALINAVQGDLNNGLIFCGAETGRITEMTTVPKLMAELAGVF